MIGVNGGTTEPITIAVMDSGASFSWANRPSIITPTSSAVRSRSVSSRQLCISFAPSKTPRTMLVLPTSIARSIRAPPQRTQGTQTNRHRGGKEETEAPGRAVDDWQRLDATPRSGDSGQKIATANRPMVAPFAVAIFRPESVAGCAGPPHPIAPPCPPFLCGGEFSQPRQLARDNALDAIAA